MMADWEYEIASKKVRWLMRETIDITKMSQTEIYNMRTVTADILSQIIEEIGKRKKDSQTIVIEYKHE